jgi:prepilin-type N-terminal cleavage/methylation domain-containing protein
MKRTARDSGFTILELTVAMTVATLLIALVLSTYVVFTKSFARQTRSGLDVRRSVVVKARVDAVMRRVGEVTAVHGATIEFRDPQTGSLREVSWRSGALYLGDSMAVSSLSGFVLTEPPRDCKAQRTVLLWEAHTEFGAWIAGAVRASSGR